MQSFNEIAPFRCQKRLGKNTTVRESERSSEGAKERCEGGEECKKKIDLLVRCETPEQYAKCTFDWVNGRLYKTDINEEPISKDLVPHADKLQVYWR